MRYSFAFALVILFADVTHAQLTIDKFQGAVEKKLAPPFGTIGTGKWKALCVCNSNNAVGALESFNGIPVLGLTCTVPSFDNTGNYIGGFACYDWTPLTK